MEVHISEKLAKILPPLRDEEREGLEADLLADGKKLHPIVYWNDGERNVIVDGMHSWEIIQRHGLPYTTHELTFDSYEEVEIWMKKHALDQRNLTPQDRRKMRGDLYNRQKQPRGGNRNHDLAEDDGSQSFTAESLAAKEGVSPITIKRAGAFARLVDQLEDALKVQIQAGKRITLPELKRAVKLDSATQVTIARDLRVGNCTTVAEAFQRCGITRTRKPDSSFEVAEQAEELEEDPAIEELTPAQRAEAESSEIESFCRRMRQVADQAPQSYWCEEGGRRDSFISQITHACGTLRQAKSIECPSCAGQGCKQCHERGYLPKPRAEV